MKKTDKNLPAKRAQTGLYASSPKARRLRDAQINYHLRKMRNLCPQLEKADIYVMRRFAECELLASKAYQVLRESGITNDEGRARRMLDDWRKLAALQVVLARELALTPVARAALGLSGDKPLDIVGEFARDIQREKQAGKR